MSLTVRNLVRFLCFLLLLACVGCRKPTHHGLPKFPVKGKVLVNGSPAPRMAVLFHHSDQNIPGNCRYPTGVSDQNGVFVLSTEGKNDGAVAGEYKVTFTWLSSAELDAIDMLKGAFGNPGSAKFQVKVPLPDDRPVEFDLKVTEDSIQRPATDRIASPR